MNSQTKKVVLVTGASGFVGRQTTAKLESDGWLVVATTRNKPKPSNPRVDFESPDLFLELSNLPKVDAIVHLASKADFGGRSVQELFLSNIGATSSLVVLAKHMNAHLVFASAALIAGVAKSNIDSASVDSPDTPYMHSKLIAEEIIQTSGIKSTILRIGGIYGLHGPTHLGLNNAISTVVTGRPPMQIGSGDAKRNYIYVKDVADIISDVLRSQILGKYLVAGREQLSIGAMLKSLCDVFVPDESPLIVAGIEACDQLIEPSPELTARYSFNEALQHIKSGASI